MSEARNTEILEKYIATGWTATKATATGAEDITIKSSEGKLGRILVLTDVITVTPKDDATDLWDAVIDDAEFDTSHTPIDFATSLVLTFSGAGSAWVLYK